MNTQLPLNVTQHGLTHAHSNISGRRRSRSRPKQRCASSPSRGRRPGVRDEFLGDISDIPSPQHRSCELRVGRQVRAPSYPPVKASATSPEFDVACRISSMSSDHHHIPIIAPLDSDEIHTVWNPYEIHMSMAGVAAVSWLQTALWSYGISLMESWRCIWLGGISRSIFQRHSNA